MKKIIITVAMVVFMATFTLMGIRDDSAALEKPEVKVYVDNTEIIDADVVKVYFPSNQQKVFINVTVTSGNYTEITGAGYVDFTTAEKYHEIKVDGTIVKTLHFIRKEEETKDFTPIIIVLAIAGLVGGIIITKKKKN